MTLDAEIGQVFGRWVVVAGVVGRGNGRRVLCRCSCDAEVVREVRYENLTRGLSSSCGCYHQERARQAARSHGKTKTPAWYSWVNMKTRVKNPNFHDRRYYSDRGITMCERWELFENFLADMGERPPGKTLDRINNDGNYEPGNCRWATYSEQSYNRRPKSRQ